MAVSIREVMTKDPITIEESATVVDAAKAMQRADVGPALITRNGELAGIITDRDIAVRVVAEGQDPNSVQALDIASTDLVTLSPDDDAGDAVKLMTEKNIRRLPIVEGNRPVGIVSLGDLAVSLDSGSGLADISAASPNN